MDEVKKEVVKKPEGKLKKGLKKFWFLLWKDNSIKGWLISLVVLFVFIKFIFFPFLNLVTGTALPLAIVESCSMYHQGNIFSNFDTWFSQHEVKYENINITKSEFRGFSLHSGFSKGDILFIVGADPDKLKIGDIIVFRSGTGSTPVIHRIIDIEEQNGTRIFTTMGDNNNQILTPSNNLFGVDEREINENQIMGKAVFRLAPGLGWIKLIFFEASKPASERGFCKQT